jgi:norsolorinic acid ketoreductase
VIEIDVATSESIRHSIQSLTVEHQTDSLDVFIANAAMTLGSIKLSEIGARRILPLIDVIAYGQLDFFKAVLPLLRKAENKIKARFMYVSSMGGCLSTMDNMLLMSPYGASKALGNFFVK